MRDGPAAPLPALPGLVLAVRQLTCYSKEDLGPTRAFLEPIGNPVALLTTAHGVRRLPHT